jgi:WD40 repeat protein
MDCLPSMISHFSCLVPSLVNRHVPGMLASCSVDKTVTLWDTHNKAVDGAPANYDGPPKACGNKDMVVGKLYTVQFYPSSPWLLGCAGGGKELALWDMHREESIQKRFGDRVIRKQFGDRVSGDGEQQKEEEPVNESEQKKAFDAMMTPSTPSTTTTEGEGTASPKKASLSKKKKNGKEKKKKPHRAGK